MGVGAGTGAGTSMRARAAIFADIMIVVFVAIVIIVLTGTWCFVVSPVVRRFVGVQDLVFLVIIDFAGAFAGQLWGRHGGR